MCEDPQVKNKAKQSAAKKSAAPGPLQKHASE